MNDVLDQLQSLGNLNPDQAQLWTLVLAGLGILLATLPGWYIGDWLGIRRELHRTRGAGDSDEQLSGFLLARYAEKTRSELAIEKDRLLMHLLNLPTSMRPWHITLAAAAVGGGIVTATGMGIPFIALATGAPALIAHHIMQSRWHSYIQNLEEDLPLFLSQLAATLATISNFVEAMKQCVSAQGDGGSIRPAGQYFRLLINEFEARGVEVMDEAIEVAKTLSPTLASTLYLLKRSHEMGGAEFHEAIRVASGQMSKLQDSRRQAQVRANGARGVMVTVLILMLGSVIVMVMSNPVFREAYQHPIMIGGAGLAIVMMGVGYFVMEATIRSNTKF